jgi:hypothetical protein
MTSHTKPILFAFFFFTLIPNFAGGIPSKMPDDFCVHYFSHIGYNSHYKEIQLKLGECKAVLEPGEELTSFTFTLATDELATMYSALRTLKAFTLKSKPAKFADRGGERIDYTILGKHYVVSNYGASFVIKSHLEHFIDCVDLITATADRYKH